MYRDRNDETRGKRGRKTQVGALALSLLILVTLAIGGTVAYLFTKSDSVENKFKPSNVACTVTETFNETTGVKSNVNVINTGDTDAYIRVKLVTYRVNEAGQQIGGLATIPNFALGTGWVKYGECYYYTEPVVREQSPTNLLIGTPGITLQSYEDADGGKQVIEVMAEAIQALGTDSAGNTPVQLAWGVTIEGGSIVAFPGP